MATLTVHLSGQLRTIVFDAPQPLSRVLIESGLAHAHPCGGKGTCGKCNVTLSGGVSTPNVIEQKAGVRLSCQTELLGDAEVWLKDSHSGMRIELSGEFLPAQLLPLGKTLGAAVDMKVVMTWRWQFIMDITIKIIVFTTSKMKYSSSRGS